MTDAAEADRSVTVVAGSLVAGVFFGGVAGGVAFPTLPSLGPVLGISPLLVGVILSINRATRIVLNAPAGTVLDRFGTRRPMLVGFGAMAAAPFGYALGLSPPLGLSSAAVFLLARVCWGVGTAFVFVGAFATITHVTTPENRGTWTGYMRGGQTLGFPTGLVVGGLVTDLAGYTTAFAVAGVAGLVGTLVAAAVLPDVAPDVDDTAGLRALPSVIRRTPRVAAVGTVNLATRFLYAGVLLSTIVVYAETYGITIAGFSAVGASGFVLAASAAATSIATVAVGRYSDRLERRPLVTLPALAVLAAGFALLATLPTLLGAIAGVVLVGFGQGGTNPPLLAYLGDLSPEGDVGRLGGVYNLMGDVGSTLGPLVALPLVEVVGFEAGYLACAGVVVVTVGVVVTTLLGETPEKAVQSE